MVAGTVSAGRPRAKDARAKATRPFASAAEMREVLMQLLSEIEGDADLGPRLRALHASYRYVFPDLGLTLNVAAARDDDVRFIRWSFDEVDWDPTLTLEMDSEVANRYLQGAENLAIAVARGRIRASCDVRAALGLLPVIRLIAPRYREVLERHYPQLLID